jgi:hypothetical protein
MKARGRRCIRPSSQAKPWGPSGDVIPVQGQRGYRGLRLEEPGICVIPEDSGLLQLRP